MQEEIDYGAGFIGLRLFVHACFTAQPCSGTVQRPVESTRNASARFGLFRSHTREKFGTLPGPRCMPSVSFHMLPRYSGLRHSGHVQISQVEAARCRATRDRWREVEGQRALRDWLTAAQKSGRRTAGYAAAPTRTRLRTLAPRSAPQAWRGTGRPRCLGRRASPSWHLGRCGGP